MEVCTFPLCTSYDMPMILVDKKIRFWLYDCILKKNLKKKFFTIFEINVMMVYNIYKLNTYQSQKDWCCAQWKSVYIFRCAQTSLISADNDKEFKVQ